MAIVPSKRLRNKIAGFTTHLMRRIQRGPVRGISFKLERRDRMTLSGRNGAGKTTALRIALDAGDAPTARRAAHTLKGVAASFGATRVQAIAHMLEDTTLPRDRSNALMASLETALEATLTALEPVG